MKPVLPAVCAALWLFVQAATGVYAQTKPYQIDDATQRFVAIGQLAQHATARDGAPRYALKDEQGDITAYVVSAPKVGLSRFAGKKVAITARSVSYRDGTVPFVLAERVTTLGQADPILDVEADSGVEPASMVESLEYDSTDDFADVDEIIPAGAIEWIDDPPVLPYSSPDVGAELLEADTTGCGPACDSCGTECRTCSACPCGPSGRFWVRPEYLLWWTSGMKLPPLVTTSPDGTPADQAGVLGQPGTVVLYGDSRVLEDARSGFRIRSGYWFDRCQWMGIEGEYFILPETSDSFNAASDGDPILARPFFNVLTNLQDSQLVAFPDILDGRVSVRTETELQSLSLRGRFNLCCENLKQGCNDCAAGCGPEGGWRVDGLVGYRYLRLDEQLQVRENLVSANDTLFDIRDVFDAENDFHGVDVGLLWEAYRNRWSLELLTRIALGNSHEVVTIDGSTATTVGNTRVVNTGGLLAQTTNIGKFSQDKFAVIPEVGLTLGYNVTQRLKCTFGYTFLYWSSVVRPGEHVDLQINPELLPPPEDPITGPLRPRFAFNETDYWAQGMNFGLDYRW